MQFANLPIGNIQSTRRGDADCRSDGPILDGKWPLKLQIKSLTIQSLTFSELLLAFYS